MEKPKIDLLKKKYELHTPKKSPFVFFGKPLIIGIVIAATVGTIFSYQVNSTQEFNTTPEETGSFFSTIKRLVQSNDRALAGEDDGRVNFLLMGIGGKGHEGPQLTDTMLFASFKPSEGNIGLMSLPRDLSAPIPGYGYKKINHANAYGEVAKEDGGPILASRVVGDVLDQDVHYYVRVDFDGFAQLVDAINGLDVYVERSFTDLEYPTLGKELAECGEVREVEEVREEGEDGFSLKKLFGVDEEVGEVAPDFSLGEEVEEVATVAPQDYSCRFEVLNFQEGWTHMDGDTALKFVRSRHGNNGEGSDFARSARQQKILLAVKDKVFSASTLLNPSRINKILNTLDENISTNLSVWQIVRLAKELKELDTTNITHHVIDGSETSPVFATVLNGEYVLLPKNDDWTPLQSIAEQIFVPAEDQRRVFASNSDEKPRFVKIEIQNGTNVTGLAFRTSQLLDGYGFEVSKIGNAASRGYKHTVIYDLTDGQQPKELKALRDFLGAEVTLSATGWLISGDIVPREISVSSDQYEKLATDRNIDFLIILGENSSNLARR